MLQAAIRGLNEGAAAAGLTPPMALAVTVLTSDPNASAQLLNDRLSAALEAGCTGIVCAATDLSVIKSTAPDITAVVPGIRPAGVPTHDQSRVATPGEAMRLGADILVIGRAVTGASDRATAAADVANEVADAL